MLISVGAYAFGHLCYIVCKRLTDVAVYILAYDIQTH